MSYKVNPKTRGSGIVCAIPQTGRCPHKCVECFFQSGRSYLEPLEENLPNMPSAEDAAGCVVRVNDGNDSHVDREEVIRATDRYPMRFFNTSVANFNFPGPVVLTVNPGRITDDAFILVDDIPDNLMFVRVRTNTWNLWRVVEPAIKHYTNLGVPVVLTFMAYFDCKVPHASANDYVWRKRTLNSYWAITTAAWRRVMHAYEDEPLVYSCGKIEGTHGNTSCTRCGNCLREYFATAVRMGLIGAKGVQE